MRRQLLTAAFLLAVPQTLCAQTDADKVRILAWYARLVASSALPPYNIVFVLPDSAPDDPKLEYQLPLLRLALQQARVLTTPQMGRTPGRDTILVLLGRPERDSSAGDWHHYTLYSSQTAGPPNVDVVMYAARLLCSLQQCFFLSLTPVGRGPDNQEAVHGLPPNKALLQSPQTLAVGRRVLTPRRPTIICGAAERHSR